MAFFSLLLIESAIDIGWQRVLASEIKAKPKPS